jgi:hypothetical protein
MNFSLRAALRICCLIATLGVWTVSMGADVLETGSTSLSAPTTGGEVKVKIWTEPERIQDRKSRIASVEITVDGTNLFVPRSVYADLVDPRQAEVQVKGSTGTLVVRGGDGADSYVARIFFDRKKVNRRTLSSSMLEGKPTEETRYWLRVMKDE